MTNDEKLLQAEILRVRTEVEKIDLDFSDIDTELIHLQDEITELDTRIDAAVDAAAAATAAADNANAAAAAAELAADNATAAVGQLQGSVDGLTAQVGNNTFDIDANRNAIIASNAAISQNTAQIAALEIKEDERAHYLGAFNTTADLLAYPTPTPNDFADNYETGTRWVYSGGQWTDTAESIPAGGVMLSDVSPVMNGIAAAGTGTKASRNDHVHPSDDAKVDKVTYVNSIYGTDSTGAQATFAKSFAENKNTIMSRNSDGGSCVNTTDAMSDYYITNKLFVKNNFVAKTSVSVSEDNGAVLQRDDQGGARFKVPATGVTPYHGINLGYANSVYALKTEVSPKYAHYIYIRGTTYWSNDDDYHDIYGSILFFSKRATQYTELNQLYSDMANSGLDIDHSGVQCSLFMDVYGNTQGFFPVIHVYAPNFDIYGLVWNGDGTSISYAQLKIVLNDAYIESDIVI